MSRTSVVTFAIPTWGCVVATLAAVGVVAAALFVTSSLTTQRNAYMQRLADCEAQNSELARQNHGLVAERRAAMAAAQAQAEQEAQASSQAASQQQGAQAPSRAQIEHSLLRRRKMGPGFLGASSLLDQFQKGDHLERGGRNEIQMPVMPIEVKRS
jgi:hypothetical protein